jgi:hypothetical protein
MDKAFTGGGGFFIVFAEATIGVEPGKGTLHNPTPFEKCKGGLIFLGGETISTLALKVRAHQLQKAP